MLQENEAGNSLRSTPAPTIEPLVNGILLRLAKKLQVVNYSIYVPLLNFNLLWFRQLISQ